MAAAAARSMCAPNHSDARRLLTPSTFSTAAGCEAPHLGAMGRCAGSRHRIRRQHHLRAYRPDDTPELVPGFPRRQSRHGRGGGAASVRACGRALGACVGSLRRPSRSPPTEWRHMCARVAHRGDGTPSLDGGWGAARTSPGRRRGAAEAGSAAASDARRGAHGVSHGRPGGCESAAASAAGGARGCLYVFGARANLKPQTLLL